MTLSRCVCLWLVWICRLNIILDKQHSGPKFLPTVLFSFDDLTTNGTNTSQAKAFTEVHNNRSSTHTVELKQWVQRNWFYHHICNIFALPPPVFHVRAGWDHRQGRELSSILDSWHAQGTNTSLSVEWPLVPYSPSCSINCVCVCVCD